MTCQSIITVIGACAAWRQHYHKKISWSSSRGCSSADYQGSGFQIHSQTLSLHL